MKQLLLITLFSFYGFCCYATHNVAGIITYRHINGNTYEATVTTYTRSDSPGGSADIPLLWGDDTVDTIPRVNGGGNGVVIANNIKMNIYVGTHTYSSAGHYRLYIEDPNRNAGVINIPNSVNIPWHIDADLIIPASGQGNNSPLFSGTPIFDLKFDSLSFNFGFYDPDSDILTYELITPKGLDGGDIPGYTVPAGVSIDHVTGQLSWNVPGMLGEFAFAIKISECKNGAYVGSVVLDLMYTVSSGSGSPHFTGLSAWNMDNNGRYSYSVAPGENFQLNVTAANATAISAHSEAFVAPNNATFTNVTSATDKLFSWQPTLARCAPYTLIFRAEGEPQRDITVLLYVREQNMQYCDTICSAVLSVEEVENNNVISLFPNPADDYITVNILNAGQLPKISAIKIINTLGQVAYQSISGNTINLSFVDISSLSPGIYNLLLENEQGVIGYSRFVINR